MDKKYLLSNGSTQIVPLEYEQQFFKLLDEANLTAELITDEPGKFLGTSQSQNNQLKVNEDVYVDTTTGEVISKALQERNMESKSDDGSLGLVGKIGNFYDQVSNTLKSLEDPKERERAAKLAYTGFVENAPENLLTTLFNIGGTINDIIIKSGLPKLVGGEELEEEFENDLIGFYDAIEKMKPGGDSLLIPASFDDMLEKLKLEKEGKPVKIETKELEKKDTGAGFVKGFQTNSAADVIGASSTFLYGAAETMIPAMLSRGRTLAPQVMAPMYVAYNEQKAKALYGKDDPNAIDKLVENKETEIALPLALGYVAYSFEKIGFEGVSKYIMGKAVASKASGTLLAMQLREGATEWAQGGIGVFNEQLGAQKSREEAARTAWDHMNSDAGKEDFFSGVVGSTGIGITGRIVNRALRQDPITASKINNQIEKIVELNESINKSFDEDVKSAIRQQLEVEKNNLKNILEKNNNIKDYLTAEESKKLLEIINSKDKISNQKIKLKLKFDNKNISKSEYDNAVSSLNKQDEILTDNIVAIKKQVIKSAAKRTTKAVKKQITDMGLEGKVTEMTSEEISNIKEKGLDSKSAAQSFGFIKQNSDGSFEIILNKDKPMEGTAAHEFMHAVLFKTLKGNSELQTSLGNALEQYVTTLGGDLTNVGRRLARYGKWLKDKDGNITGFKKDANFGEETITIMSESILDGSLEFNEGFFTKIGDIIRRFFKGTLGQDYEFNTGRDVYNFIKDFNNSIKTNKVNKAIIKVAKEGAKGKLVEKKTETVAEKTTTQMSKDFSPSINEMGRMAWTNETWEKTGANFAIEEMKKGKMLDGLILAAQARANPSVQIKKQSEDVKKEFVDDVYTQLTSHIKNFRPEDQGESGLFGWINPQLGNKSLDVQKRPKYSGDKLTRAKDLDAKTEEGTPRYQVADTALNPEEMMIAAEEAAAAKEKLAKVSKETLEKKLGLDEKADKEFQQALVTAFGTKLPEVDSKKLRTELRKIVADKLRPKIQKLFGREKSYDNFIQEDLPSLLGFIKVDDLIQIERLVGGKKFPNGRKILASKKRITSVKEVRRLQGTLDKQGVPLIDPRIKPESGPSLKRRLNPTPKELLAAFRGTNAEKILGYQPPGSMDSGMLGARKDRLAELLVGEIAFNKAIQVAEQQLPKIQAIEEIQNRNITENYIAELGLTLDRDPTIQYSKETVVEQVDLLENLVSELGVENVIKDGKLLEGLPVMSKAAIQMVEKLYDNNVIMSESAKAFKQGIFKSDIIPQALIDKYKNVGNLRFNTPMLDLMHTDSSVIALELGPEIMNAIGYEILGYKNRTMDPAKQKKDGSKGEFYDRLINLKDKVNKKKVELPAGLILEDVRMMNKSFPLFKKIEKILELKSKKEKLKKLKALKSEIDAANTANIKLAKHIASTIIKLTKKGKINPITALNILQAQTGIVQGFRGLSRLDLIDVREGSQTVSESHPQYKQALKYYKDKGIKNPEARALERVGSKGEHLAPNSNTMKAIAELIYRKNVDVDSELDLIFAKHSQLLTSKYIADVIDDGPGGKTSTADFNRIKYLKKSDINNIVSADGRSYQDVLGDIEINSMQLKFVNKVVYQESKGGIDKINNQIEAFNKRAELIKKQNKELQKDLEKRGYKFSRGMSTFDFDETVGVSENFVIAKKGKDIKRIASNEWPFVGEQLAKDGYKFDFSDFNKVTKGKPGPLFEKMKNQIKKYGPENVFILTARAPQSEQAIHDWLKSNGINIPRKNVTGLGNSTGQAKADWMLEKFAEGYNDMYFVDDALPNVKAVKDVLDQLDIKSKVVQAKIQFSRDGALDFNTILEQTKGVPAGKRFSAQEARKIGIGKGRLKFFVPPSAEDFKGLVYSFLGRGREGDAQAAWFKENLFDPFAKGIREWNVYKQAMSDDYQAIKKQFKNVGKILNDKVPGTVFTNDNAIRVYLWDKAGYDIPGLDLLQQKKLVRHVNNNAELSNFADALGAISRVPEGYVQPEGYWAVQSIASDLSNTVLKAGRKDFLAEWIENKNIVFSEENLNKIEAIYGTDFRDALENMLHRMETGTNRPAGKSKQVNMWLDWINGSVAATMFVNVRSAALQTISTVNFINMADNNILKASIAFANQPQYWKDFSYIFNSPMLKQRRAGLQIDVSASEITRAYNQGKSRPEAILAYLLEKGFLPTQIADSFAISAGGATFYRNRINTYLKKGMSKTEAEKQAWLDFQEVAEETQQSSRPDLISMQQAGPMGRLILAWQNTPMQMTRLTKKKISDLVKRRRIPGYTQVQSDMANIQGILYYGVIQNLIFGAMQTGLMFLLFGWDEDEERKRKLEVRVANGALDTILRGTGIYGAAVSTLKNVLWRWHEERQKPGWKRDDWNIMQEAVNLSPPIGSKMRKIMSAVRTEKYNKGVSKEIGFRIENPNISIAANWTEALTNIPVARVVSKANNVEEALNSNNDIWQRVALVSGWSRWSVGVEDEELKAAKEAAKEKRSEQKKVEQKKQKEEKKKKEEQEKKKKGIKTVRCSGTNSSGKRCSLTTETTAKTWKCFHHAAFKDGMDRDGDGLKEYRCTAKKADGSRCKNKTENKNKKCYAHQ